MPVLMQPSIAALLALLTATQPGAGEPRPAAAQEAGDLLVWTDVLDSTVVRAPRPTRLDRLARGTGFATLIDIPDARGPAEDAADLLERTVGANIRRYGGPGATATLSIRGIDPGHVEVFIDRVPMRTASRGQADLSALDLAHFEAIEVYRSHPPADLGGEACGAAIRLVPRSNGGTRAGLRLSAGSYGTRIVEASASLARRGTRGLLSASRFQTEGDFRYHDDNATEHEPADDRWRTWTNGDVRRDEVLASLTQALLGPLSLDLSGQFYDHDQGVPGTRHQPTRGTRLATEGFLHRGALTARSGGAGHLLAEVYGHAGGEARRYRDPERELAVTGTATRVDQEQDRAGVGARARWTWAGPGPVGVHAPEILWEQRSESLRNLPAPGASAEDRRRRDGSLLSLGETWEPRGGRVSLEGFYRWERVRSNFEGANPWRPFTALPWRTASHEGPRLGLRCDAGRGWTFKAGRSRHARFPTFVELFGYAGTIQGNARLAPERGRRWDAGFLWEAAGRPLGMQARIETSYYESRLEQMIVLITISDRETKPANLDRARIRGAELALALDHLPWLRDLRLAGAHTGDASLAAHVTWQEARDEGRSPIYRGKELTYHPPWQAGLQLDLTQGRLELRHDARYQDGAYWSRSNLPAFRSPDYWNHDLTLRWSVGTWGATLSLRVENLFDRHHEDIRGYPLPGRSWFGGLDLKM